MCIVKQQAAGSQSDSFLVTMQLCLLLGRTAMGAMKYEPYRIVSIHWLKMASLIYLNLFFVDTEVAVEDVLWEKCCWKFCKIHQELPMAGSLFLTTPKDLFSNKVADSLKKILWHKYFPMNFESFLSTPILKIIWERLLKSMHSTKPSTSLALLFSGACSFVTVLIYYLKQDKTEYRLSYLIK